MKAGKQRKFDKCFMEKGMIGHMAAISARQYMYKDPGQTVFSREKASVGNRQVKNLVIGARAMAPWMRVLAALPYA